ncbi:3-beta hydroxysteroid dehydrogenase [Flexivirga endophytica]|uniref:3-beta hydroxysteroid dehydrogenase n=1 Tax=Flexivirga endophytica TaxID=1849103 RepID=A0A916T0S3_9MICO|nr:SDR family oxidoreductase [Flexivirga endophytica]GGB23468.1 3-beta hydroxysteroid dehydrogenase [Flexivirga endophytica]GHB57399.1 3-beta hydroxysteroid dehydrogenase [Flexivirga endophytica]
MRVLVAGSTGYLGGHIVRELNDRGHHVRALVRNPDRFDPVRDAVDEVFTADATDPGALAGCCDGVDAVVSCVGLVGKAGRQTVWDVDYGANRNLLEEAGRAAVDKFVYTSVAGAPALEKLQLVRAKRAFEQALRDSGTPYTILRPNGFFSDFDVYLEMARKGRVYLFGDGGFRINPISGADVAAAAADALGAGAAEVELGGPDLLTHEEIAQLAFRAIGASERITHIPAWILTSGLALLRRLTPLRTYGVVEFPLTVLTHDVITPATGQRQLADHYRSTAVATT